MNKQIIYTNKDNQDFSVMPYTSNLGTKPTDIRLSIANGCNELYFLDKYEVDEFCKILQEVKKEVWGD